MKPVYPILPLVLLCGVVPVSAADAGQRDEVQLAQEAPPGGEGGKAQENNTDQKDHGKGRDKGRDGQGPDRGQGGKGQDRGQEGQGPERDREGRGPDRGHEGRGPDRGHEGRGQDRGGDREPGERKGERPPVQQPPARDIPQEAPLRQLERRPEQPKPEAPQPKVTPPPQPEERKGPPPGARQPDESDHRGRDRDRSDRNGRGPERAGPDQQAPVPPKGHEPKSETKAPEPKAPLTDGGNGAPKPESRPAPTPPPAEPSPKASDRNDHRDRSDRDGRGPDRAGPDQQAPVPPKGHEPKSETKAPDQKAPPTDGGNGAPKPESKPVLTPPPAEPSPKASDRNDHRDRSDRDGRGRDRAGPDQQAPVPSKGPEPKSETKAPDQKAPPTDGGNGAPKAESKPAPTPPAEQPPKASDRNDRDRVNGDHPDSGRRDDAGRDRDWRRDRDRGPQGPRPDQPERGRWGGDQPPAPSEARDINDLKARRREHSEEGGRRIIIEEPDKRRIIREDGHTIIRHDETERFRRIAPDTRFEKRNGLDISVSILPGGIRVYTDLDNDGRPLRRYRRGPDGRDVVLFDNRDYYRRSRHGSFLDAIVDLPPPRIRIPRERYIVDYDRASYDDVYEALDAGPVDDLDRGYSLEEVRRSPMLRDRMRRVDLDTVNFDFGSWTVNYDQYGALERVAQAMSRIIDRNPGEMFMIEGHTDAVGSDEDNLSLSDRRAESVAIILTKEFGVPPENLTTQGYGEQYLKIPTDGPERANRRVAVRRITPLLAR